MTTNEKEKSLSMYLYIYILKSHSYKLYMLWESCSVECVSVESKARCC